MNKIWYIIQREYITRVRKKSFIVLTLLLPFLVGLLTVSMLVLATNSSEKLRIAILDESHLFQDKFRGLDEGESLRFAYLDSTAKFDVLKEQYQIGYDGLLYIPAIDIDRPTGITYYSENELGISTEDHINKALNQEIRRRVLLKNNYNEDLIDKLDNGNVELTKIIKNEKKEGKAGFAAAIGYVCGLLIYIFLIVYGAMVMKGITEEKSNRIVEVLITAVKPFELMLGKIIGIGAVGLTQFILWGILTFLVNMVVGSIYGEKMLLLQQMQQSGSMANASETQQLMLEAMTGLTGLNYVRIALSFIFYFIFGYIFYSAQFAAIGAAMTDDSDAQSFTFPITIPIIISMVLMSVTLQQPHSSAALWGSYLPFSSPIIMMTRIPFNVPWSQQLLSMFILVASSLALVWAAAKIYRIGILIQGKKVTFKEIGKWVFS